MKVSLIDIENHFEAHLIQDGQDLVRASNEYAIQQPDANHYQVHSTHPAYQVDMMMLADGMVNVKCYCAPFKKLKTCKHVVAALFLLRDNLIYARRSKSKSNQDNTAVEEALQKIKITDLRKFLAAYARSHATFKAELLANTLHLTKKPDYAALLQELTPIDKYGQLKINRNNIKTLRGIISILLKQAQQLYREKALPETFQILEPTIHQLYRLIFKFPQYLSQLTIELKTALRLFESLCFLPMAPRLQQATIKFAMELSNREGYFFLKNIPPVLRMVESFVLEEKLRASLIQLLEHKIKTDTTNTIPWSALLLRWSRLWNLRQQRKEIIASMQTVIPDIIQEMHQHRDYEDVLIALKSLPKTTDGVSRRISLSLGLKSAILMASRPDIISIASEISSTYFDIDAWNELEQEDKAEAEAVIRNVNAQYPATLNELADLLVIHGFHMLHLPEELLERLIDQEDPETMMQYDRLLMKTDQEKIVRFYANHIRAIKEAYGGVMARQKLNNIFSHLKATDLYTAVAENVKQMDARKSEPEPENIILGFVFDLDGVIVDTAVHHFQGWKKLMLDLGHQIAEEDDHQLRGASRMESLEFLLHKYGVSKSDEEKAKLASLKNEYYLYSIEELKPDDILPGVLDFLKESRRSGLAIALGSASKNAKMVLEKLEIEDYFDAILDGHSAEASKPDPEIFIKACLALKLKGEQVVVFEDAAKGVQAALAAGCYCVGLGDPVTLGAANMVIPDFTNVTPQQIMEQIV